MGAAISLEGATKSFEGREAVENLTLSVEAGTIVGLIGPSGSGKTTAVRMVLGVHLPDTGRVVVLGQEPRRFGVRLREKIGYMPQHFVLYPELSVRENLDFVASCYGVSIWHRNERLRRMLEFVELTEVRHTPAGEVSGGQQRRLELACTLIHQPELIVLDEPTAGIDPVLRQKFWDHFRELRDQGRTLLVTTQYVTEAEYCDSVAVLREGQLVAHGHPDEVRRAAMGGEILTVQAPGLARGHLEMLARLPGVLDVRAVSPEEIRLTVEEAGTATPRVMSALQEAGIQVANLSEYRPNFDEVFVRLMERQPAAPPPVPAIEPASRSAA